MDKSKLIKTLKKLSEEEFRDFDIFVRSPYFNTNHDLVRLLALIEKEGILHQSLISEALVLKKMYPTKRHHPRKLTDLMYQLNNLLEEFLSMEHYRKNRFLQKITLMSVAYEKDLEALTNGIEKDLEVMHIQNPVRDSNYFYERFMIHSERDYSFRLSGKISEDASIQVKSDQLDLFYLALKLKDACEML